MLIQRCIGWENIRKTTLNAIHQGHFDFVETEVFSIPTADDAKESLFGTVLGFPPSAQPLPDGQRLRRAVRPYRPVRHFEKISSTLPEPKRLT